MKTVFGDINNDGETDFIARVEPIHCGSRNALWAGEFISGISQVNRFVFGSSGDADHDFYLDEILNFGQDYGLVLDINQIISGIVSGTLLDNNTVGVAGFCIGYRENSNVRRSFVYDLTRGVAVNVGDPAIDANWACVPDDVRFPEEVVPRTEPPALPNCIDWARSRPVSEDRRMIGVFSNRLLSGQAYETFDRNEPPIAPAITDETLGYRSTSYVFRLFDVPKDEFESTAQYLHRRQGIWETVLGRESRSLTIGHQRLEFTYDADRQSMLIQARYSELESAVLDHYPPAIRFSQSIVNRGTSSLHNNYYLSASNGFFGRLESSFSRDRLPLRISMDGATARDVNATGALLVRFSSPVFRSPRLPGAFRNTVSVEHPRAIGSYNVVYGDLECAVLASGGGAYYDLLSAP